MNSGLQSGRGGVREKVSGSPTNGFSRILWPRGLGRMSAAARFLGLWVRIPPGAWMSVSCECYALARARVCVCVCVAECDQLQK